MACWDGQAHKFRLRVSPVSSIVYSCTTHLSSLIFTGMVIGYRAVLVFVIAIHPRMRMVKKNCIHGDADSVVAHI